MKNTYTYEEVTGSYWKGYRLAFFACILGIAIGTLINGCGDAGTDPERTDLPVIDIVCDEAACTILVHEADTITTWHDGEFYWHDDIIPPGRRYTNRDMAPEFSITVEACNEFGCVESTLALIEFAQTDDPIGCDPDLPCPFEALS